MEIKKVYLEGQEETKGVNNPRYIIIHHPEIDRPCSITELNGIMRNMGYYMIGYNFYVRKNGEVYEGRPVSAEGANCYGYNTKSIGVCFEGDYDKETSMPQAQFNAGVELIRYLRDKYGIANNMIREPIPNNNSTWSGIGGHKMFSSTECPGRHFPLNKMLDCIENGTEIIENKNGFYVSEETRENATIVGSGDIEVLDENCKAIPGRYISSLDRVFVLGIYPSRKYIEVVYPGKNEKYHAYIDIKYYSRLSFDYHMKYQNDGGVTYVWWDSNNVNKGNHDEELKPNQCASPMYRVGRWLRITFYRADGTPSDGFVRYEGQQEERFYEDQIEKYGRVINVKEYLNVRDGANTNSNVIGKVFLGEKVKICWTVTGWHYIEYNTSNGKKEGYVSASFIEEI